MSTFTAAAVQMEPTVGDLEGNVEAILNLGQEAANNGAQLIVYPELATSGYSFESEDEARASALAYGGSATINTLINFCKNAEVTLVAGYAEREGENLYNSAIIITPDGNTGNYRKNHLWNLENTYFEPGNIGHPVFETPLGTIGLMVCYDCWFPETARSLVLQGADLICVPTNWVPIPGQPDNERAMATVLCQATAHVNGIYIVGANRVGTERGQNFLGQSIITDYSGWHLAGPASPTNPEILYAEIDLQAARDSRQWNDYNHPVKNRRVETYDIDRG